MRNGKCLSKTIVDKDGRSNWNQQSYYQPLHKTFLGFTEVGIYKRKQESMKTRKHAFDQESDQE